MIFWLWVAALLPLQSRASDIPRPAKGYEITLVAQNLGTITALAMVENDIFVLDSKKNSILRLRDQNQNGSIDMQTVYLLGFDRASHMVALGNHLYISDANGIWKSQVGKNLAATTSPTNIVPFTTQVGTPLAVSKTGLYAGISTENFTGIVKINYETNAVRGLAKSELPIQALTTSPNGQLWAVLKIDNDTFVVKTNKQATLTLTPADKNLAGRIVEDMLLWQGHLLLATSHPNPEIIKYGFAYGELAGKAKPLISGFSNPSISVGEIDIWGSPTAMTVSRGGKLLFADGKNGTIWEISKAQIQPPKININQPITPKENLEEVETSTAVKPPTTVSGSSISSASSLSHGSAIGKDELLGSKKKKSK